MRRSRCVGARRTSCVIARTRSADPSAILELVPGRIGPLAGLSLPSQRFSSGTAPSRNSFATSAGLTAACRWISRLVCMSAPRSTAYLVVSRAIDGDSVAVRRYIFGPCLRRCAPVSVTSAHGRCMRVFRSTLLHS